jgi:hypothetical protein
MTLQEIHDYISAWPQRAIQIRAGVCAEIINAAKAVADVLPDEAKSALAAYQHIADESGGLQVVLDRDKLLAITRALVSPVEATVATPLVTPAPSVDDDEE